MLAHLQDEEDISERMLPGAGGNPPPRLEKFHFGGIYKQISNVRASDNIEYCTCTLYIVH